MSRAITAAGLLILGVVLVPTPGPSTGAAPLDGPAPPAAAPVESITLGRFSHATLRSDETTIRRDGSITSKVNAPLGPHLERTARIDPDQFRRLVRLAERIGIDRMAPFHGGIDDADWARVVVRRADGTTTAIRDVEGSTAPVELWGFEQAIDGIAAAHR